MKDITYLKHKLFIVSFISCLLFVVCFKSQSFASSNVCNIYVQEKSLNQNFVYVNIASAQNNVIALLVLGYPKFLNVSVNGIDVKNTLLGSDDIICNGHLSGEIRYYDMKKVNVDAGVFEVRASNNVNTTFSFSKQ